MKKINLLLIIVVVLSSCTEFKVKQLKHMDITDAENIVIMQSSEEGSRGDGKFCQLMKETKEGIFKKVNLKDSLGVDLKSWFEPIYVENVSDRYLLTIFDVGSNLNDPFVGYGYYFLIDKESGAVYSMRFEASGNPYHIKLGRSTTGSFVQSDSSGNLYVVLASVSTFSDACDYPVYKISVDSGTVTAESMKIRSKKDEGSIYTMNVTDSGDIVYMFEHYNDELLNGLYIYSADGKVDFKQGYVSSLFNKSGPESFITTYNDDFCIVNVTDDSKLDIQPIYTPKDEISGIKYLQTWNNSIFYISLNTIYEYNTLTEFFESYKIQADFEINRNNISKLKVFEDTFFVYNSEKVVQYDFQGKKVREYPKPDQLLNFSNCFPVDRDTVRMNGLTIGNDYALYQVKSDGKSQLLNVTAFSSSISQFLRIK